ncbi:MAG TPA: hypothetical protein VFS60_19485 [Thermoanaerobaculia bacterium]|nr:hypothetical protein [Thermoanaerobaculia bacterium]
MDWSAIAAIVTAVFTASTWFVYHQIKRIMERAHEKDFMPVLLLGYGDMPSNPQGRLRTEIVVANHGKGAALSINITRLPADGSGDEETELDPIELKPGEKKRMDGFDWNTADQPTKGRPGGRLVARYRDIFDNWYETAFDGRSTHFRVVGRDARGGPA